MKRKLKWIGVVLVVAVMGVCVPLFMLPRDRITVDSYKLIRIGMTEKEVEEILGGPGMSGDEYISHMTALDRIGKRPMEKRKGVSFLESKDDEFAGTAQFWIGHRGLIYIGLDLRGHVNWKGYEELCPADPSFIDRLRNWLGW